MWADRTVFVYLHILARDETLNSAKKIEDLEKYNLLVNTI